MLCVLDGWGESAETDHNALALARLPHWRRFVSSYPKTLLDASEEDVGLPPGQMGNSEVGHMNLGAGRVVTQELPRIDKAVADGSLAANPVLRDAIAKVRTADGTFHLMGLMSPGGVHSHQDQIAALARIIGDAGVPVAVHAFLDGRDTPPRSAKDYVRKFVEDIAPCPRVRIATIGGRYYAMDRDKRWERLEKAYRALVVAEGERAADPIQAIEASYAAGKTDEFMLPAVIGDYRGLRDGDGVLMANFRADRARQLLAALADPVFTSFPRPKVVRFSALVGMGPYSDHLNRFYKALFAPQNLNNILGQVVAEAGMTQLRIAETEKYAHVTFFLNGGREMTFPGEDRILVPSPKVATYDLQPEMSGPEVTDKLIEAIKSARYDLIVVNYANSDMVGHTGVLPAAIKAAESIDAFLGRLEAAVREAGGVLFVTADHGNLEMMYDPKTGQPHTAHTTNPVPLIMVNAPGWVKGLRPGRLADVAPTLLHILELPKPAEMTGQSLIEERRAEVAAAQ